MSLLASAITRRLETEPGALIQYQILPRPGAPTLVLANGLGGRLYAWEPLVERLASRYQILSWDYRGLFGSGAPSYPRALAIPSHARDLHKILAHEGVERASLVGWSMGVQVSLEAALQAPRRIERLVLLNGTYGHVFQTGLQPLFRAPGVPSMLHAIVERLTQPSSLPALWVQACARHPLHVRPLVALLNQVRRKASVGSLYAQYVEDVFGSSFPNYLRLFQELDAHSVYHYLPRLKHQALVVSGALDWLTPARQAFRVAKRLPHAEHLHLPLASHFALIEYPERVSDRIEAFLEAGD